MLCSSVFVSVCVRTCWSVCVCAINCACVWVFACNLCTHVCVISISSTGSCEEKLNDGL